MTASTGTVHQGFGRGQLGLALTGVALVAAILAGGYAIGQLTKVQLAPVAPAPAAAPAFDHGTAIWDAVAAARPTFDHGSADLSAAAAAPASALNRGAAFDPALNHGNLGAIPVDTAAGLNRPHYDSNLGIWETAATLHGAAWDPALPSNLQAATKAQLQDGLRYDSATGVWETIPFTLFPNGARRGYDGSESAVPQATSQTLYQNVSHYDSELGIWVTTPLTMNRHGAPGRGLDASPNRFQDHSTDSSVFHPRD